MQTRENEIRAVFGRQRAARALEPCPNVALRRERLRRLEDALESGRAELRAALRDDLGKPEVETDLTEIYQVLSEARHARRHLARWMRPRRVRTPFALWGTRSVVRCEPKGVVLVLAPWNYPVNLTFGPLVSALAAGNRCVLKPSELTPASSAWMARAIRERFDPDEVALFEGEADVAAALTRLPFDHVFFTGSPQVGKLVLAAATEHLTPVTLELGGKSPALVDASADLVRSAERIVWGKFTNAGQTCIAPDYVLAPRGHLAALTLELTRALARAYGPEETRATNPDLARLVSEQHFERLSGLLAEALAGGARLVAGGSEHADLRTRTFPPTLVADVRADAALLHEEIFGPILPLVAYDDLDDALAFVRARPKPLALYVFSGDPRRTEEILTHTTAGGSCVNDVLLHFAHHGLPFGGVGPSGHGKAHGFAGFRTFSNERAVLTAWSDLRPLRHLRPPYTERVQRLVDFTLRWL